MRFKKENMPTMDNNAVYIVAAAVEMCGNWKRVMKKDILVF